MTHSGILHGQMGRVFLSESDIVKPVQVDRYSVDVVGAMPLEATIPTREGVLRVQIVQGNDPPWLWRVFERLKRICALPEGWDSYGGRTVSPKVVARGLYLLDSLLPEDAVEPSVVPTSNGGIQFEWHRAGVDLEIEIDPDNGVSVEYENFNTNENWTEEGLPEERLAPIIERLRENPQLPVV